MLAGYVGLAVLARTLPPGLAREVAGFLPACVVLVRRLRAEQLTFRARLALVVCTAWVLSPIDLVPEFLPVVGLLDDVIVVLLTVRFVARSLPRATVLAAWPADQRLIQRLLGSSE